MACNIPWQWSICPEILDLNDRIVKWNASLLYLIIVDVVIGLDH